jgi:hypothetical protein
MAMTQKLYDADIIQFPYLKDDGLLADSVGDLRFRKLLKQNEWQGLPETVRARFSKRLTGTKCAIYTGRILEMRMSRAGWFLAQISRIIGGPLPTSRDVNVPAVVSVTEDEATGGQLWTRMYNQHSGFPQVIHSAKRFSGATGLEEYIGFGVGMALNVDATDNSLFFHSDHYFLKLFALRLRFPRWLSPGWTIVSHVDLGDGNFEFILDLHHPWFGELIHQTAVFSDS